jgi:cold shock CspA family protein
MAQETSRCDRSEANGAAAEGELRGTIAVSVQAHGYGFIEPDTGGGQLLVRRSSIDSDRQLRVGDPVRYALATGPFALEAVGVSWSGGPAEVGWRRPTAVP